VTGRFHAEEAVQADRGSAASYGFNRRVLGRVAVACLIAGIGLLNLADAASAHAVGVVCLLGFTVTAFLALIPEALGPVDERGAR
jgi:hypothetical protein